MDVCENHVIDFKKYYAALRKRLNEMHDKQFHEIWNMFCEKTNKPCKIYENGFAAYDELFGSAGKMIEWAYSHGRCIVPDFDGKYVALISDRIVTFDSFIDSGLELNDLFQWITSTMTFEDIFTLLQMDCSYEDFTLKCSMCHKPVNRGHYIKCKTATNEDCVLCDDCARNVWYALIATK